MSVKLAVGHYGSPYVTIYTRAGDVFTKVADLSPLPPDSGSDYTVSIDWNSDGTSLAGITLFNNVFVYNVSGSTYTKLTNPLNTSSSTMPWKLHWNNNGSSLAVCSAAAPYFQVYDRVGDTFTPTTITYPGATGAGDIQFSPDGNSVAIIHNNAPYLSVYTRSGTTYTRVNTSYTAPTVIPKSVRWNHDGTSLLLGFTTIAPTVYNYNGTTLTKLTISLANHVSQTGVVSWNHNGTQIAYGVVAYYGSDTTLYVYNRSGDTFTAAKALVTSYASSMLQWNATGTSLAVGQAAGIAVYNQSSPTSFTLLSSPAQTLPGNPYSMDWVGSTTATGASTVSATANIVSTSNVTRDVATSITSNTTVTSSSDRTRPGLSSITSTSTVITNGDVVSGDYVLSDYIEYDYIAEITAIMDGEAHLIALAFTVNDGEIVSHGQATLIATSTVTSSCDRTRTDTATLTATSDVIADSIRTRTDSATLSDSITITSTSNRTRYGSAALSAFAISLSDSVRTKRGNAVLSAVSTVLSSSDRTRNNTATLIATSIVTSSSNRTRTDSATLTAQATSSVNAYNFTKASANLSAFVTNLSDSVRTKVGNANLIVQASIISSSNRTRTDSATLTSQASIILSSNRTRNNTATLVDVVTMSNDSDVIRNGSSSIVSNSTVTSSSDRTRASASYFVSTSTVTQKPHKISAGVASLLALDTVVSGAAYKVGVRAQLNVVSSVTADADRIAGGTFDSLYRAPTGIIVDSIHHPCIVQLKYPAGDAYVLDYGVQTDPWQTPPNYSIVTSGQTIISFWAQFSGAGCIWSCVNVNNDGSQELSFKYISSGFRLESAQQLVGPNVWTSRVDWASSANDGQWHHYTIKINDFASELNIDGHLITQTSQAYIRQDTQAPLAPQWNSTVAFPINLGAKVSVSYIGGWWTYTPVYTDQLTGAIAQLWIGDVYSTGSAYSSEFFAPLNDYYRLTTNETPAFNSVQGKDGYGITFSRVYFYDELDYPYLQAGPYTVNSNPSQYTNVNNSEYLTRNRSTGRGTAEIVRDINWIPATTLTSVQPGGARARFTLSASSTKIRNATSNVTSIATITKAKLTGLILGQLELTAITTVTPIALRIRLKQPSASLTVDTSLIATDTNFTKASASLNVTTSLDVASYEFTLGNASLTANATTTFVGLKIQPQSIHMVVTANITATSSKRNASRANLTSNFTVLADGDDQNNAIANLFVTATVIATDTNFTKAQSVMTAICSAAATGNALVPQRGNVLQVAEFNLASDADVIRGAIGELLAIVSTNNRAVTIASSKASLLAFAVSVTAGRVVHFLAEYVLIVPQEQNGLLVVTEPRLTKVGFENSVNTVLAESQDIVVEQENGLLLSQFN